MAKYDWKIEKRDEDWSDDTYAYFLIHINLKRMAEYLTKEFKKDWWFKADYGQDNCYIVAENNNFPVRLFFTFEEGGWADITRHYTDGATLKDDHLGSWHFGKYDVDYSYAVIRDNIENYFYKFEESMKEENKFMTLQDAWDNDDKELFLSMIDWLETNRKITSKEAKDLEEIYDNWKEYKEENPNAKIKFGNLVTKIKESLTESFEYEGAIPLEELMNILDDEWKYSRGELFGESSHWDDESRDEGKYIEISSIVDFAVPYNTGYSFSNKKIQKQYDESIKELLNEVEDDDFDDVLYEYEPILLVITIDLKEEIIYASVDLGNGVTEDVAREKLADNEKDFRKQIQRMIESF